MYFNFGTCGGLNLAMIIPIAHHMIGVQGTAMVKRTPKSDCGTQNVGHFPRKQLVVTVHSTENSLIRIQLF